MGGSLWWVLRHLWSRRKALVDSRYLMAIVWALTPGGISGDGCVDHSFYQTWCLDLALIDQGVGLANAGLFAEDDPANVQANRKNID